MMFRALVLALLATAGVSVSNDVDMHAQLVNLQHRHVEWLLNHPDVTAVDVDHKTVGGQQTDQLSLVIWVKKKLPEEEVPEERRLPREIEGFQTDVIEGEIVIDSPLPFETTDTQPTAPPTNMPTPSVTTTSTTTKLPTSMPTPSVTATSTTTKLPTSMPTPSVTTTPTPTRLPTSMPTPSVTTTPTTTELPTSMPPPSVTMPTPSVTMLTPSVTMPTPSVTTPTTSTMSTPSLTTLATETPTSNPCPCRDPLTGLRGGNCIRRKNGGRGTLGYFTKSWIGIGILSNCHVTGPKGNIITTVPRRQQDYIATVAIDKYNEHVDASHSTLCRSLPPSFQPMLVDGTKVLGSVEAKRNDSVRFCGCISGCTQNGIILSTDFCFRRAFNSLCDDQFGFIRCNQLRFKTTPIGQHGDSGSLLINADTKEATGLIFGGRIGQYGLATRIETVYEQLRVELVV